MVARGCGQVMTNWCIAGARSLCRPLSFDNYIYIYIYIYDTRQLLPCSGFYLQDPKAS